MHRTAGELTYCRRPTIVQKLVSIFLYSEHAGKLVRYIGSAVRFAINEFHILMTIVGNYVNSKKRITDGHSEFAPPPRSSCLKWEPVLTTRCCNNMLC